MEDAQVSMHRQYEFEMYQASTGLTAIYDVAINTMDEDDMRDVLRLSYLSLGLAGEAAEVANKVKKVVRGDYPVDDVIPALEKELGDVLWYVSELCSLYDISLADVAVQNIEKLLGRQERGVIKGDGDNR